MRGKKVTQRWDGFDSLNQTHAYWRLRHSREKSTGEGRRDLAKWMIARPQSKTGVQAKARWAEHVKQTGHQGDVTPLTMMQAWIGKSFSVHKLTAEVSADAAEHQNPLDPYWNSKVATYLFSCIVILVLRQPCFLCKLWYKYTGRNIS